MKFEQGSIAWMLSNLLRLTISLPIVIFILMFIIPFLAVAFVFSCFWWTMSFCLYMCTEGACTCCHCCLKCCGYSYEEDHDGCTLFCCFHDWFMKVPIYCVCGLLFVFFLICLCLGPFVVFAGVHFYFLDNKFYTWNITLLIFNVTGTLLWILIFVNYCYKRVFSGDDDDTDILNEFLTLLSLQNLFKPQQEYTQEVPGEEEEQDETADEVDSLLPQKLEFEEQFEGGNVEIIRDNEDQNRHLLRVNGVDVLTNAEIRPVPDDSEIVMKNAVMMRGTPCNDSQDRFEVMWYKEKKKEEVAKYIGDWKATTSPAKSKSKKKEKKKSTCEEKLVVNLFFLFGIDYRQNIETALNDMWVAYIFALLPAVIGGYIVYYILNDAHVIRCDVDYDPDAYLLCPTDVTGSLGEEVCCEVIPARIDFIPFLAGFAASMVAAYGAVRYTAIFILAGTNHQSFIQGDITEVLIRFSKVYERMKKKKEQQDKTIKLLQKTIKGTQEQDQSTFAELRKRIQVLEEQNKEESKDDGKIKLNVKDREFKVGDEVKIKDHDDKNWRKGTVESVKPLRVKAKGWKQAFEWDEVKHLDEEIQDESSDMVGPRGFFEWMMLRNPSLLNREDMLLDMPQWDTDLEDDSDSLTDFLLHDIDDIQEESAAKGRGGLLDSIRAGKALKKVDKSAPRGPGGSSAAKKPMGKMSLQEQLAMRLKKGGGPKKTNTAKPKPAGASTPQKPRPRTLSLSSLLGLSQVTPEPHDESESKRLPTLAEEDVLELPEIRRAPEVIDRELRE